MVNIFFPLHPVEDLFFPLHPVVHLSFPLHPVVDIFFPLHRVVDIFLTVHPVVDPVSVVPGENGSGESFHIPETLYNKPGNFINSPPSGQKGKDLFPSRLSALCWVERGMVLRTYREVLVRISTNEFR